MNKEIKDQWVAALRSGEYKQGRNALKRGDSYCCLGVLCDLAVKNEVIPEPQRIGGDWYYGNPDHTSTFALPDAVRVWAGSRSNPTVNIKGKSVDYPNLFDDPDNPSLASLNDSGVSFRDIANLIEEQL